MPVVNDWQQLIADLSTGIWRLKRRVAALGTAASRDMAGLHRDVESLVDRLGEAGVDIIDHSGEVYEPGKALRVLAFQPAAGASREEIGETVKPTVYYGGQWLQMGEVIVSTPESRREIPPSDSVTEVKT